MGKLPVSAILLCLGLLAACTRTGARQAAAVQRQDPKPAAPSASSPPAGAAETTRKPPSPSASTSPAAAPQAAQPLAAAQPHGLDWLRTIAGTPRLMAEDFSLGPLGDALSGTDDQKAALLAAEEFLASLLEGAPSPALLSSRSGQAILELLEPLEGKEAAPAAYRLGGPVPLPGGELSANLRLFRGEGTAEGEIYLGKEAGRWLVTDVQVNPSALALARKEPARKFFPSPYRWLLGE